MALYSWFSRNKSNQKSTRSCYTLLKAPEATKCVENYTMWPTAKIKSRVMVPPPLHSSVESKPVKNLGTSQSVTTTKNLSIKSAPIIKK